MPSKHAFKTTLYGKPAADNRVSHDLEVTYPCGRVRAQTYYADPARTLARLRHNIAHAFWFDRMRARHGQTDQPQP